MQSKRTKIKSFLLNLSIALVWFVNGLFCKVLNLVPRHQQIVARILGDDHASILTGTIGVLEIFMSVWVISRIHSRLCTFVQIVLIATMNIIEFTLAPDLLLFGRMNILVATLFILVLVFNEYYLNRKKSAVNFKY